MERNSYGRAVLANLRDTDPSRGIPDNLLYMPMSASMKNEGIKADRNDTIAGIYTLQPFREVLFTSILSTRIKKHKYLFRSEDILNEVYTLVEKNGRIDHKSGAHDDLLFAFMIAHWVLTDHYAVLMRDYPDVGARKIYQDIALEELLCAKDCDMNTDNLYTLLSEFRKYYEDIVDDTKDVINISNAKQGMFTYDELMTAQNIIMKNNGGEMPKNKYAPDDDPLAFRPEHIVKQSERINDEDKRKRAKQLGMSEEEYRYVKNARAGEPQQIEYNEQGVPYIVKEASQQHSSATKNKFMNIFGNRR